ncbi:C4-type zinc ribbon domain-containing protein [Tsukamurella sp. 8F]|uniref:zinc ribbon domain-containing protein n=1 Tax=unclassified Tsukamurella TaxID=2633480 RepID=UPI0023B8E5EB|nr:MULTISPECIES: C4-type zinc ribbon domain-containing protein [unclassified Tsukamurella]MDF0529957.1 C4-type zinc ribbon domain-containing protein [Tsukamurella sp. 8J]MDF0587271.1 C4-type zinc ribbon domain-containing protein [Tsukamurella sp. 8F]
MNADPAAQRQLLDLADVDAEIARLAHRLRHLPEDVEIAELEKAAAAEHDESVKVSIVVEDFDRDIKKLEHEVDQTRLREEKDRALLQAGTVGAKQLRELEHELGSLERRQTALEDDLLELMEKREAVQLDQQRAEAAVNATREKIETVQRRREESLKDVEVARRRTAGQREDLVGQLPGDLYSEYERRRSASGVGAGLLRARRCGACRLELDRGFLDRVGKAAPESVIHCDECGAILVRTNESGL